jgi:hypothetical protein
MSFVIAGPVADPGLGPLEGGDVARFFCDLECNCLATFCMDFFAVSHTVSITYEIIAVFHTGKYKKWK